MSITSTHTHQQFVSVVTFVDAELVRSIPDGGALGVPQTGEGEPEQLLLALLLRCGRGEVRVSGLGGRPALGTLSRRQAQVSAQMHSARSVQPEADLPKECGTW